MCVMVVPQATVTEDKKIKKRHSCNNQTTVVDYRELGSRQGNRILKAARPRSTKADELMWWCLRLGVSQGEGIRLVTDPRWAVFMALFLSF